MAGQGVVNNPVMTGALDANVLNLYLSELCRRSAWFRYL